MDAFLSALSDSKATSPKLLPDSVCQNITNYTIIIYNQS